MALNDTIQNDIKAAMLARDKDKLEALRAIKSAILLELSKDGSAELTDEAGIRILSRLQKQRQEAAEIYRQQGRAELAEVEEQQAAVIQHYLPKQLSLEELENAVRAIMAETGASGMKDMGKVMGQANSKLAGQTDGKTLSETVRRLLAAQG